MNIFEHCRKLAEAKRETQARAYQCAEKLTLEEVAEQMIEDLRGEQDEHRTSNR